MFKLRLFQGIMRIGKILIFIVILWAMPAVIIGTISETAGATPTSAGETRLLKYAKADFLSLDAETARDIQIIMAYVRQKNKNSRSLVNYVVAKNIIYRIDLEHRFKTSFTRSSLLSLIIGIIEIESGFNPFARSNKDARGLMQVHQPTWGRYFTAETTAYSASRNLEIGTAILYYYFTLERGDLKRALYRYYGAKDNAYVTKVLAKAVAFKRFYEKENSKYPAAS